MLRLPFLWYTSGDYRSKSRKPENSESEPDPTPASDSTEEPVQDVSMTSNGETDEYQIMLNLKHFQPEQILVKTVDNSVVIHGKHEESTDHHGYISREFTRKYELPDNVDPTTVKCAFSCLEGTLTVMAPFKQPEEEIDVSNTVGQTAGIKRPHEQSTAEQSEMQVSSD